MTLTELITRLEEEYDLRITPRQVRFLISEGFCPPPTGGRKFARYGKEHLRAVTRYYDLRDLGFPPAAIKRFNRATPGVPFPIGEQEGITVVIAKERMGSGEPVEPLLEEVRALFARILGPAGNRDESGRPRPNPAGTGPGGASPAETPIPGAPRADSPREPTPAATAADDEGDET